MRVILPAIALVACATAANAGPCEKWAWIAGQLTCTQSAPDPITYPDFSSRPMFAPSPSYAAPRVSPSEQFLTGYIRGRMLRMQLEEQYYRTQAARSQAAQSYRWGDWEPMR